MAGAIREPRCSRISDFALTRFYDPAADLGVAEEWIEIDSSLTDAERGVFLGFPIHSAETIFDPGRMGSYFQTPEQVLESLEIVNQLTIKSVESFKKLLQSCSQYRLEFTSHFDVKVTLRVAAIAS